MKTYTRYKKSGVSWIGDVPEQWNCRKFQYLFKERSEKNHPNEPILCATQSRGVIPQSMYENRVVVVNTGFEGLKLVKKGDFVISLRSFQGGIEYAYYQGIISAAYTILRIDTDSLLSDYVRILFKSAAFIGLLKTCVTGIREGQNINNELLRKQLIPIPPLSEQKAIAEYLDKKTAQINELVSAKQKQIELLKEYKQSVIANAVTGKLNKDCRMKDSGISWIGKIPENWEVKRVASFFDENKVLNKDFVFKKAYQFKFGSLVMKNEVGDEKEYEETYVKYTVLNKNDIVLNGLNLNYDFVSQRVAICPAPGIITSAYIAMTPRKTVEAMYYLWLFKTMDNKKMLHGMGSGIRLTLSFSDMKNQRIPVPPLSEQKEIVVYIEKKVSSIDSQIASIENQIANLNEYKQSLISDVVTGKVKVC